MVRKEFPSSGEFSIGLRDTQLVLDVHEGSLDPGTAIIVWNSRTENNDNQKWTYVDGRLRNKKTGLVLSVPSSAPHTAVDQQNVQDSTVQKFEYYDYTISVKSNDDLVLGIIGAKKEGARVALIPRDNDSELQQWSIL
ncbi:hypothetical protein BGX26_000985 [Mortierella sp. AD094]|nr:hypothetical protein BGX26_000985 [Mortierella sp. AD094]